MDEEPQSLLTFVRKLREVFDACDSDSDGLVRVAHFAQLGAQFGRAEQAKRLAGCLHPDSHGRIDFKDFCRGVFTMKGYVGGSTKKSGAWSIPGPYDDKAESCYLGAGEDRLPVIMCTRPAPDRVPECQLFPGEVEEPEEEAAADEGRERESDRDSAVESTQGSDTSDGPVRPEDKEDALGHLFFPGEKRGQTSVSVTSDLSSASLNEEQFEDYGEGEEPEYAAGSPCPDDETRTNGCSDLGSSVPSSAGQTPRKVRQHYSGDPMDVYCSQCSKKVNLLNDLEVRLKNLKTNSPNRKITSTAFGRQLLHNSNLSSSNGSTEDLFRDSIDSCDIDIHEKVTFLEKKVAELEKEILMNVEVKSRLKQENTQIVHRVHELEEQLKDQETRAEQSLQEGLRRHRESYGKMERDKSTQIELLTSRVKQVEEENSEMSLSLSRLKSQTEKLDEEKQRMTDKLEDTSLRLRDEMDLYKKMMDKLRQNRQQFQKEKEAMQELIEDLRRELEHLQLFKLEAERTGRTRSSSSGLADFNSRTREVELEHEVKRLKQQCVSQDFLPHDLQHLVLSGARLRPGEPEAEGAERRAQRSDPQPQPVRGQDAVRHADQGPVPRR
ncbi:rab11 family-interacting protein 4B isoform X3 [Pungitius pungitius]|uniref:rab11 family-interacting protein 4B isoform X3 n=1 Tax=Pungitius pungitius TaxID=134920 RepID=UPI002E0F7F47